MIKWNHFTILISVSTEATTIHKELQLKRYYLITMTYKTNFNLIKLYSKLKNARSQDARISTWSITLKVDAKNAILLLQPRFHQQSASTLIDHRYADRCASHATASSKRREKGQEYLKAKTISLSEKT